MASPKTPLPAGWTLSRIHALTSAEFEALHSDINTAISSYLIELNDLQEAEIQASFPKDHIPSPADLSSYPLPPGWNEERIASDIDALLELGPKEYFMVKLWQDAHMRLVLTPQFEELTRKYKNPEPDESTKAAALEMGFLEEDLEGDLRDVVDLMMREGLDVWGYVVFKTWGYGDREGEWDVFWEKWRVYMEDVLSSGDEKSEKEDLTKGVRGKVRWHLVEDESLDGASAETIRQWFEELVEAEDTLPDGLDLDLCLMIDEGSIKSITDDESRREKWVWTVGKEYNSEEKLTAFKTGIANLIPDMWLHLNVLSPEEMDPGEGRIFCGVGMDDIGEEEERDDGE